MKQEVRSMGKALNTQAMDNSAGLGQASMLHAACSRLHVTEVNS